MKCALCEDKLCYNGKDCTDIKFDITKEYAKDFNQRIMAAAAEIESEGYMKLTRIEELIAFCKKTGYKRVGLAFCIGLEGEARIFEEIMSKEFEMLSVCCKVCAFRKGDYGFKEVEGGGKSSCNPIGQAMILNLEKTDLNIIMGLCVGHDLLFTRYSEAPVTTIAVKDRVLAHNPLGAIYSKYHVKRRLGLK